MWMYVSHLYLNRLTLLIIAFSQSLSEQFHNCLAGNPFNRWFDKSLTVVVTSNATQAINVEHTTAEATVSCSWT